LAAAGGTERGQGVSAEERRYRVVVVGNCCTHGEFVVNALRDEPGVELVGGWEADASRAPGLAKALGVDLVASPEVFFDDPSVDIVAVATSPHEKAGVVERAAMARKHVFLNKPMAESLTSARKIAQAVRDHGVQLVHDIIVFRFNPLTARVLHDVQAGAFGRPLHYAHSWGMTFSRDFPLAAVWPERLDPAGRSGGGEMTNMGCYAIDYMTALWGLPRSVQAKWARTWDVYRQAGVENFGQVIADYGGFFAALAVGKQTLRSLPSMDVGEALQPRNWHNVIQIQFEDANLTLLPYEGLVIRDGRPIVPEDFVGDLACPTPFQSLVAAIETGEPPQSNADAAALGVEVLMAAYRSITEDRAVELPLADGSNPLAGSVSR
jgi:predicted dehydrogenase